MTTTTTSPAAALLTTLDGQIDATTTTIAQQTQALVELGLRSAAVAARAVHPGAASLLLEPDGWLLSWEVRDATGDRLDLDVEAGGIHLESVLDDLRAALLPAVVNPAIIAGFARGADPVSSWGYDGDISIDEQEDRLKSVTLDIDDLLTRLGGVPTLP